jgi:hypothetical protein
MALEAALDLGLSTNLDKAWDDLLDGEAALAGTSSAPYISATSAKWRLSASDPSQAANGYARRHERTTVAKTEVEVVRAMTRHRGRA